MDEPVLPIKKVYHFSLPLATNTCVWQIPQGKCKPRKRKRRSKTTFPANVKVFLAFVQFSTFFTKRVFYVVTIMFDYSAHFNVDNVDNSVYKLKMGYLGCGNVF